MTKNKKDTVANIPRGVPKSGRVWKSVNNRSSSVISTKSLKSSWEKKMKIRQEKKNVKAFAAQLKDTKDKEKEKLRLRREENKKRREENSRKAEIVQVELRKLLRQRLKLKPNKIKVLSAKQSMYAFVNFRSEEDRNEALTTLSGYSWRNHKLRAKKANPMADPYVQKKNLRSEAVPTELELDDEPISTKLKNAVIPLWNIPYSEQIAQKEADMRKLLMKLGYEIEKVNPSFKKLFKSQREKNSGLCCQFLGLKPSPTTEGYRNKCEFTIGYQPTNEKSDNKLPTIGFRLSRYSAGSMAVVEPDECFNIDEKMKIITKTFQNYIRQSDKIPFCAETHVGYWRQLTVRTTKTKDIMAIIVMHPQTMSEEELDEEKKEIVKYFTVGEAKDCGITSLFLQLFTKRISGEEPPLYHLSGEKFIREKLFDLTFHISPEAFFQVNTLGAEILYTSVEEMLDLNANITLLDICCGTGTIGLTLAKKVGKVIGVELNSSAVKDAKQNAEINGIENTDFVCGKAEDTIYGLIKRASSEEIVAIVDPPRAGLNSRVVKVIRSSKFINKVVYVACNAVAAKSNFLEFCRTTSNNYKGDPFYPTKAVCVDMFPHTPHCELVLLLERKLESSCE
ncbi:tRNA (uracil-5-)-methyltransferase A [Nymphon striatum]|nr:tRNA (uracil-5-)-methyltransferase A [Nymphon striatum]